MTVGPKQGERRPYDYRRATDSLLARTPTEGKSNTV